MNLLRHFLSFLLFLVCLALFGCGGNNSSSTNTGTGGTNSGGTTGGTNTGGTTGGTNTGGTTGGGTTGGTPTAASTYVYAISGTSVVGYKVQQDGSLQSLGTLQASSQLRFQHLSASPDGKFLYSLENSCVPNNCGIGANFNYDNHLLVQEIRADGSLGSAVSATPDTAQDVIISPESKVAFALTGPATNRVTAYPIKADGTFGAAAGVVQLPQPMVTEVEGGNAFSVFGGFTGKEMLWVSDILTYRSGDQPRLVSVRFDPNTGAIIGNNVKDMSTINEPEALATTTDKVVTAETTEWSFISTNTTTVFNPADGDPQLLNKCTSANNAGCGGNSQMIGSPTQSQVFAIHFPDSQVSPFQVITLKIGTDGSVTPVSNNTSFTAGSFSDLAVDPAGKYVVLSSRDTSTITLLPVDQSSGALSVSGSTNTASAGSVVAVTR